MVSHIGIGKRDMNAEYHWSELDDSYQIERPTLLILGGSSTLDARAANGYAKIFSSFLGLNPRTVDVVAAYYKDLDPDDQSLDLFLYNHAMADTKTAAKCRKDKEKLTDPLPDKYAPHFIDELFTNYFLPLISAKDGTERLSTEEAKLRLRNLNIVTHCYGGYVALVLEQKMSQKMAELGYSEQEQREIQKQMVVVALAPPYGLGLAKSTTLSVASVTGDFKFTDRLDGTYNNFLKTLGKEYADQNTPALAVAKLSENESVIGVFSGQNVDPKDQREHTIDYFTEGSEIHTKMIRCFMETALTNSIKNATSYFGFTELPALEDAYTDNSSFGLTAVEKIPDYPERMRAELAKTKDFPERFKKYQDFNEQAKKELMKRALNLR